MAFASTVNEAAAAMISATYDVGPPYVERLPFELTRCWLDLSFTDSPVGEAVSRASLFADRNDEDSVLASELWRLSRAASTFTGRERSGIRFEVLKLLAPFGELVKVELAFIGQALIGS